MARLRLRTVLSHALLLGALLVTATACKREPATPIAETATPQGTIQAAVKTLKANDLKGLIESQVPPADLAKIKADFKKDMDEKPPTEKDRQKFAENMSKLTAPDAEAKLMAELEPQLAKMDTQLAQQMPMYVGLGRGLLVGAIQENKELTETQKAEAIKSIDALAKWAETTKFTDRERAKRAIAAVVSTARALGMKNLDELRALSFEQALDKGGIAIKGLKQALDAYGFSIDQTLDSVKAETVSQTGDTAKVRVSYVFLGAPISYETEMVKIDDRWYGKQTVEQLRKPKVEKPTAEPEAPPVAEEEQPEDEPSGDQGHG
jgi:hypothetical protein